MDYTDVLIKRIHMLCDKRKISINKLAAMCGLNQSTLNNIMRGKTKDPQIRTLHRIALGFCMTLSEFLDFPELNEYSFDSANDDDL